MSYVWGGGTFVKREGTTADKLDFAFACARAQDFMKILQSCLCRKLLKILRKNQVSMALFLSATIHQGDELFSAQSRGKQCAFMSLSAVLTAQHNPLIDWSTTTFNNVLLQGDKMYLKALNSGLVVLEEGVEFLSVDNLPKVVGVSCCASMFSYQIRDSSLIDKFHNISPVVHGCTTPLRVTNRHLPLAIEPIEAQNNIELPVVVAQNNNLPVEVEPIEAQNNIELPVVVAQNNNLPVEVEPIEAQNNIELPVVVAQNNNLPVEVEPIEAQNNIELPVVVAQNNNLPVEVEPGEGKSINDLPIVVQPTEAQNNNAKNQNQIWLIKYGKEYQGLIITDRELESHYYDIHTALLDMFLNYSSAILILEGYMMALIKQTNFFYLFDSHARDFNGMPDSNGTAVVMKFTNILELEQFLLSLSTQLHTNLFEIVPVHLEKSNASQQTIKCAKGCNYQRKRHSRETEQDKQVRLNKAKEYKKRKQSEETDSERGIRLQKLCESVKGKRSKETDSERQIRLNQNRLHKKQMRANPMSQPQNEMDQEAYLNLFDNTNNGGIEEQCWAKANINKFHKSVQYIVSQCTVCQEAWPLKSKPRSPYVCSRCSRDKKILKNFLVKIQ